MDVMVVKAPPVSQAIFFSATVGRGWGPTAYEKIRTCFVMVLELEWPEIWSGVERVLY